MKQQYTMNKTEKPVDFSKQESRILSERVAAVKGNTAKRIVQNLDRKRQEKKVAEFKAILTEGLE